MFKLKAQVINLKNLASSSVIEDADSKILAPNLEKTKDPVFNYRTTRPYFMNDWQKLEYDFKEIDKIATIEAYLQISFDKKLSLFTKEGYEVIGKDPDLVEYVERRLNEVCYVSRTTPRQFITDIAKNIIRYSNCFVLVKRNDAMSGGYTRVDAKGRKIAPISSLHILPTSMVQVKVNDLKQPVKYRQYSEEDWTENTRPTSIYEPNEIIHFHVNKLEGFVVGTPRASAAIEDIKALRRIESDVEVLLHQSIFPIVQYKVGTEEMPATILPDGRDEITMVTEVINNQPPEGFFVTPERHEIKMIGAEGRSLRGEGYLDYFKKRVLAALGLSSVDIGEGDTANRSTAATMSSSLINSVKSDQLVLEEQIYAHLIVPLLQESTEDNSFDWLDPENKVSLRFKEIDVENQIKKENAAIQLWLNNAISHDELRDRIGMSTAKDEDWEHSYYKMVTEAQELLRLGANPMSPLAETSAKSDRTPMSPADLKKAQDLRMQNSQPAPKPGQKNSKPEPKDLKKKIR
ncbi:MAG: hypothetical protein EB127_00060 [Alphaproteobacteria bacterium]|nr:hypothetical protein [Alphaproteobacteria bacterium]